MTGISASENSRDCTALHLVFLLSMGFRFPLLPVLCVAVRIVAGTVSVFVGFALVSDIGVGIAGIVVADLVGLNLIRRVGALFLLVVSVARTFSGIIAALDPSDTFGTVAGTAHTALVGPACPCRVRALVPFSVPPFRSAARTSFGIAAVDSGLALPSGNAVGIVGIVVVGPACSLRRRRRPCRLFLLFLVAL